MVIVCSPHAGCRRQIGWRERSLKRDRLGPSRQGLLRRGGGSMVDSMADDPAFLSGKFLLAMPGMADPRFERAVIALCVHDENGAIGIGIGHKRAGISFRGLLKQLDIDPGQAPDQAVHHGGPVEPGRGFILHSPDWGGQDTLHVADGRGGQFAMTGTIDVLKAIAEGRGPHRWVAALGYAGWSEGQLDEEMTRHGWLAAPGDSTILFDTPTDERWAAAFKGQGIDPRLLTSETGAA
jgi:putative transcriptional regulator